jgi:hypothetical protein
MTLSGTWWMSLFWLAVIGLGVGLLAVLFPKAGGSVGAGNIEMTSKSVIETSERKRKVSKIVLLVIGAIVLAVVLFAGGAVFGQVSADQRIGGMMGLFADEVSAQSDTGVLGGNAAAMMASHMAGGGMMGNAAGMMGSCGGVSGPVAGGMMGGRMMGGSMLGGCTAGEDVEPLTADEARTALEGYLEGLDDENLALGRVLIFDNHAYAQIMDVSAGRGAFEVLVEPVNQSVFPAHGPNMMWNSEYSELNRAGMAAVMASHMAGGGVLGNNADIMAGMMSGMMAGGTLGGMMGGYAPEAEASVTVEEAAVIAQRYLDEALPGTTVSETAETFPGYYTLFVEADGEISGVLSVNAYTGQVFYHHWHGSFVEQAGE